MRIIFFDIDCLRPDHLGCYGYDRPTSPTIDAIARQGTRFNRYYCGSAPCLPSRTAWSSGRFGVNNGVTSNHGLGAGTFTRIRGQLFHLMSGHIGGQTQSIRRRGNGLILLSLQRGCQAQADDVAEQQPEFFS